MSQRPLSNNVRRFSISSPDLFRIFTTDWSRKCCWHLWLVGFGFFFPLYEWSCLPSAVSSVWILPDKVPKERNRCVDRAEAMESSGSCRWDFTVSQNLFFRAGILENLPSFDLCFVYLLQWHAPFCPAKLKRERETTSGRLKPAPSLGPTPGAPKAQTLKIQVSSDSGGNVTSSTLSFCFGVFFCLFFHFTKLNKTTTWWHK